jgi:transposase
LPDEALPTFDTLLQQTKAARVLRRAQAVREVVTGQRLQTVSDPLHFPSAALRQWGHRFAQPGGQRLGERPRSGRPPQVTAALAPHLQRRGDHDPRQPGASHAPWSGPDLARTLARQPGGQLSRESGREG